jgi:hypothetical protein
VEEKVKEKVRVRAEKARVKVTKEYYAYKEKSNKEEFGGETY